MNEQLQLIDDVERIAAPIQLILFSEVMVSSRIFLIS